MTIYFGENLKRLRKEKELTQEALAGFLGITYQSISKWERGESYPDITMLPAVASFFGVTVDNLLGVDKFKQDRQIQAAMDRYLQLRRAGNFTQARKVIKKAVTEFPGDFRLLVRLMDVVTAEENISDDGAASAYSQVKSIYDSIQNYCTDDGIRMWSKRLLCTIYKRLQNVESSGVTSEDLTGILEQMPALHNSRDYISTYILSPGNEHDEACRKAIDELMYLLCGAIVNYCYYDDRFTPLFKIGIMESQNKMLDELYPHGDYGKNFLQVVYRYGHLGHLYFEAGNTEKAIANLQKCAELAKKYDNLPEITERTSPLFEGMTFKKESVPKAHSETMSQRMKRLMLEKYQLSTNFKDGDAFKRIIAVLDSDDA